MGIQTARRPFLRQDRLTGPRPLRLTGPRPLRLEDVVTPEQEDVAHDYTSDMGVSSGENSMQRFRPMPEPVPLATIEPAQELPGMDEAPQQAKALPSNRNRQMAEQLLSHGEKPFSNGAGWWGVADRVAATGVGSWMDNRESERESEAKKASLNEFLGSLDPNDPVHRYAKTIAVGGDVNKATDLILRHETQKEIAKMRAAQTGGYKQRTYNKAGQEITEQSQDGGKTWQPLSSDVRFKPSDGSEDKLSDAALELSAQRFIRTGDLSVYTRLPFKEKVRLDNRIAEIFATGTLPDGTKLTPEALSSRVAEFKAYQAGLSTLERQSVKIDMTAAEADRFADVALKASAAIPRGQFVPGNAILMDLKGKFSDPRYHAFVLANTDLAHAQAGVAGRGQTNVHLQELFERRLNTAVSHEAYAAMVNMIKQASAAIKQAKGDVREHTISSFMAKLGADGHATIKAIAEDRRQGGAAAASSPAEATTAAKKKRIKDPDNPGKTITVIQQPDGSWQEE